MNKGDLCFFYHSNIGKEIVGIVEVIKESFIDPTDKMKKVAKILPKKWFKLFAKEYNSLNNKLEEI